MYDRNWQNTIERKTNAEAAGAYRRLLSLVNVSLAVLLFFGVCNAAAAAAWSLDSGASHLSFASIKQGNVGDSHHFGKLEGGINDADKASVKIDLSSVETGVDIRNKRMQKYLFHVDQHPDATVTAKIDMAAVNKLAVGESMIRKTKADLSIASVKPYDGRTFDGDPGVELAPDGSTHAVAGTRCKPLRLDKRYSETAENRQPGFHQYRSARRF